MERGSAGDRKIAAAPPTLLSRRRARYTSPDPVPSPNYLEHASKARDVALTLVLVIYALGFITWAVYSWWIGLSFIKVADMRYLLAGVPSFIFLASLAFLYRLAAQLRTYQRLIIVLSIMAVIAVVTYRLAARGELFPARLDGPLLLLGRWQGLLLAYSRSWHGAGTILGLTVMYVVGLAEIIGRTNVTTRLRQFQIFATVAVIASSVTLIIFVYSVSLYPSIPQELGGAQPRCARVALKTDVVDPELLKILTGEDTKPDKKTVIADVTILYSSETTLLVSNSLVDLMHLWIDIDAIEIPQNAVAGIAWCRYPGGGGDV